MRPLVQSLVVLVVPPVLVAIVSTVLAILSRSKDYNLSVVNLRIGRKFFTERNELSGMIILCKIG